jgi:hypothetical protein
MTSAMDVLLLCLEIPCGDAVWICVGWKSHKELGFYVVVCCVWQAPIRVPVSSDKFWLLTKNKAWTLPSPFGNKRNYVIRCQYFAAFIIHVYTFFIGVVHHPDFPLLTNFVMSSLSQLVRWMAPKAEELVVEVYPGFAASGAPSLFILQTLICKR